MVGSLSVIPVSGAENMTERVMPASSLVRSGEPAHTFYDLMAK